MIFRGPFQPRPFCDSVHQTPLDLDIDWGSSGLVLHGTAPPQCRCPPGHLPDIAPVVLSPPSAGSLLGCPCAPSTTELPSTLCAQLLSMAPYSAAALSKLPTWYLEKSRG